MRSLLLCGLLWLLLGTVGRAAAPVEVKARVDRDTAAMGQTIRLEIELSLQPGVEFHPPPAESLQFPPFEVRDAVMTEEPSQGGRTRLRYTVRLAGFEVGDVTLPPARFGYVWNDQEKTAETEAIPIKLTGAVPKPGDKEGEIRDLKPAAPLPIPPLVWLAGALALALLAWALWALVERLLRRKVATPEADLPLADWVLRELERLQQERLIGAGRHKEFYQRLTDLLRYYLSRRYGLPALERTTPELTRELRELGLEEPVYKALRSLFEEGDLVKFALYRPPAQDVLDQLGQARAVVERTRPQPEPEGGDGDAVE